MATPGPALDRTRSAHDFGADLTAGSGAVGVSTTVVCSVRISSATSSSLGPSVIGEDVIASPATGGTSCFSAAGGDALDFGKPGMLGTAIAVLVFLRACDCVGVIFGENTGACAGVAGVETCVKSLSDGACEVAGVSGSDGAAIVDVSEGCSSAAACSCIRSTSGVPALAGKATESSDLCRF